MDIYEYNMNTIKIWKNMCQMRKNKKKTRITKKQNGYERIEQNAE